MLTVPLVDMSLIRDLVPLGSLNPPAHTHPTDHLYLYGTIVPGVATVIPIVAPGDMVITQVERRLRTGGGQPNLDDYSMDFFPCGDLKLYFSHLGTLTADLIAKIGALGNCEQSSSGGFSYSNCEKRVNVKLTAGTPIGTMGGDNANTLDFGGYDRRVPDLPFINRARSYGNGSEFGQNRTICPVDYYVASVAAALRPRFSGLFGRRTVEPVCGTIMQDLPNTAQGRWFFNDAPMDDQHLALAHDNVDPRLGVISAGTSIPSVPTNIWVFTPAASGRVNADFRRVAADGLIYCYQTFFGSRILLRHILIQLMSATRVRIEGVLGATCGDPATWAFTAGAREFTR